MEKEKIDNLLYSRIKHNDDSEKDLKYQDYYLEQYRIYLHIFNTTGERRNRSNEFFLGLNTAIIGIVGYLETKQIPDANSLFFTFIPLIGICICYCWYQIINSYKSLNRAKFNIIHTIEEKLPISLFKTEWELLGRGKDKNKYRTISSIEKRIPEVFIALYIILLITFLFK